MQHSHGLSHLVPARAVTFALWTGLALAGAAVLARPGWTGATGPALAIALLTLFVAAVVATFSLRYMRADGRAGRFFLQLGALVAGVLALLLTDHLVVLGAAWCATGWLLAGLIGHGSGWSEATAAARRTRQAFLVGDAALVAALLLLGWHAGSLRIGAALAGAADLPLLPAQAIGLLLVVAAAARCAVPPFSGWLLSSMTAPTPVSALMHAGLVNAGGFLLIRFAPVFETVPAARGLAVGLGLCGALYGLGIMLVRPDVKRGLAGSTVSQMGFMLMSCGLGAYAAALWHIVAHGLFKAWLFLGSGSAVGIKSTRPIARLSLPTMLAIGAGTFGLALVVLASGRGDAGLVPLMLALATATATLLAALDGQPSPRATAGLLLAVGALAACHALGLGLTGLAIGAGQAPAAPAWLLLALLGTFLGAWIWQQRRIAGGRSLPLPIYVHLINAGRLPAPAPGEPQ